jgi:hypothetical protein
VVFIVAFALYFYFRGKKAGKDKAREDLKDDLEADVDPKLLQDNNGNAWSPEVLADRLHKDIYAGMFTPRDIDAYKILLSLNDPRIKAVHNYWLANYFDEDNETLKVAIDNEMNGAADWRDIKASVLAKFSNLGLK